MSYQSSSMHVSRLAPSPTGALHLGNAFAFLANWALAAQKNWNLILRIEDLDGPRIKPGADKQSEEILAWLGTKWTGSTLIQSIDLSPYIDAMNELASRDRVFRSDHSRSEVEQAASAPHDYHHETQFPPALRPDPDSSPDHWTFARKDTNYRLKVEPGTVTIHDQILGTQTFDPATEVGDFIVWTRRETPAYQLAVVVDDHRQNVTDVVRGNDLLPSAARQECIYNALGWTPPNWWHLPLVRGTDGKRLAKRHGDTRVQTYRDLGVQPRAVIGLIAFWCRLTEKRTEMSADDFAKRFALDALPRDDMVFTEDDDTWLRSTASGNA